MQASARLEASVNEIINEVLERGDQALIDYTRIFDNAIDIDLIHPVPNHEQTLSDGLKKAIKTAYNNIRKFHLSQKEDVKWVETMPGVRCCRRSKPIEKVGLYIPGGSAPLFSSFLMLGVPAKLAGCKHIVVCTPPQSDGSIHPAILYTAQLLGISELHPVGGAQAIAAMAYGTKSIPKVYKILGPGNQYVTMAKQLVSTQVAIDFPAGPSEVAVLADSAANPDFIAADLLSQAEHGPDSQVVLATNSGELVDKVKVSLAEQLATLPRKNIATQALGESKMLIFPDLEDAMEFLNTYAPEHLILNVNNANSWADRVTNAGLCFRYQPYPTYQWECPNVCRGFTGLIRKKDNLPGNHQARFESHW
jgi:histidinol dehydrogenase